MVRLHDALGFPAVLAALIVGLALRVTLIVVTPVGGPAEAGRLSSYNDEIAHIRYVQHLLEHSQLPGRVESIQDAGALERGNFENYQPPLYYVFVAAICRLAGQHDLDVVALIGRLTALVCSLMMLWVLLRIAVELSLEPAQTAATVIFWALNGVMVRFGSTAGNDPLFWLFSGAMVLAAMRMGKPGSAVRDILLFSVFAVAGLYTKLTALILLPLLVFALIRRKHGGWIATAVLWTLLVFIASLPVWWRNVNSFGSLFPLSAGFGAPQWRVPDLLSLGYAVRSFFFPWPELWGGAVGLIFMAPLILMSCAAAGSPARWRVFQRAPVLLCALILTFVAYLGLNLRYDQAEARYLFAAWPSLALLLSMPLRTETARWLLVLVFLLPYSLML